MENPDFLKLMNLAQEDFEHYKYLPFAVYITHSSGVIIEYNEDARALLQLKKEETIY